MVTILCGIDWASDHHDVALIGPGGRKLGRRRISDDAAGLGELTGMFAGHGGGPGTVKIAIETERGLLVASLRAAGYQIYPVNPKAVDRYRDRHHLARANPMPPRTGSRRCSPLLRCASPPRWSRRWATRPPRSSPPSPR